MSANGNATHTHDSRISLPAVLLSLCLLALVVSLFGLFRTSGITQTRVDGLQASWQELKQDGVEGSEVLATDRLMQSVSRPVPAVHSAARWSLAMGVLSLVFFSWLLLGARSVQRGRLSEENQQARNDQAAMAKLLDEMAPLASGDLAVHATARSGTAGALSDAFNHAVNELQRLAGIQLSTSLALGESVNRSLELAETIEQQCAQQTRHIHQSSNSLLGMSSSTGALSANAAETSVATKAILDNAQRVASSLSENSKHIDNMRLDADMSIRLVQSVEQHARSIEDSVAPLDDLARRTDLLAVNTTIRASAKSTRVSKSDIEQLTDEVAKLAEALGRVTDDISALTGSLRADTTEAMHCAQRLHSSCDTHFAQTRSLSDTLVEICEQSQVMHTHAVQMAEEAVSHSGVVKDISENMNLINQITEQTGQNARMNAQSMDVLKRLANDLRQSTSDFNLPDSPLENDSPQPKSVARLAAERAAING